MGHALIVCVRHYNGHELWGALDIIVSRGHSFEVVSTGLVIQDEETLKRSRVTRTIDQIEERELTDTFDSLMIVSGNPVDTEAFWKDPRVHSFVDSMHRQDKPIAAICAAVPAVRSAAKNKKVSYYPLIRSRQLLREAGAILQKVSMTRDGNLITAENEMMTEVWAEEFCLVMEGEPQKHFFTDSGFEPKGRPRKPIPEIERLKAQKLTNRGG